MPEQSPTRLQSTPAAEETLSEIANDEDATCPVGFWARRGVWPRKYLEFNMEYALARKRLDSATSSSTTPSDQKPREEKSAQYQDARYETLLATKGVFLKTGKEGLVEESQRLCRDLFEPDQDLLPQGTIFDSKIFEEACNNLQNKNEARINQDFSRLIVPSAETLSLRNKELGILTESVNEGWNNSIPLTGIRPQPDYSVAFRREAFTGDQLAKLSPFIGDFLAGDLSFFMGTYYMYFPFLSCEVKCGAAAIDVADRQNAHTMALAARGIVELFRLVHREGEVHRQVLSFSVSHDHRSVRIYGYYPVIDGKDTKYYRQPIHEFSLVAAEGKERWTTYQFTKNIYNTWAPGHFKRICSAIDQLPSELDFGVQALSESTGVSHDLDSQLALSEADFDSLPGDQDGQPSRLGPMATPDTLFSQPSPPKRRKSPAKTVGLGR